MGKDFSRNLIKGKIAEIIFEQMFRKSGKYIILHTGYEHTMQELAQYRRTLRKEVIEDVSGMSDYILMSINRRNIYVVEVKYRRKLDNITRKDLKRIAEKILKNWDPAWLFVATQDGFFFDLCSNVIKNSGKLEQLPYNWVNKITQEKCLKLLKEFIK